MTDRSGVTYDVVYDVTIVTHGALPGGAPDDRLLGAALERRGASVRFAAWDDPAVSWTDTRLALVRSAWDYYRAPDAWAAWVARAGAATALRNPPPILRWNGSKRYLLDLMQAGVPCVPTEVLPRTPDVAGGPPPALTAPTLPTLAAARGWSDVVVKPAVAASAFGARRFAAAALTGEGEAHLRALRRAGDVLVQPYMAALERTPERSLVYVDGRFAHAFTKPAFSTDAAGGTAVAAHAPAEDERRVAAAALAVADARTRAPLLYARVDLVRDAAGPAVMELELIEPDLALRLAPIVAERLADACLAPAVPPARGPRMRS